jgi:hypothetical protein
MRLVFDELCACDGNLVILGILGRGERERRSQKLILHRSCACAILNMTRVIFISSALSTLSINMFFCLETL